MKNRMLCSLAVVAGLGLTACTNPYDPGQRAVGGGLIGAGSGAALGAIAGGGRGAAIGALAGGALGATAGAVTTQRPPPQGYGYEPAYSPGPQQGYYQAPPPREGYYEQQPRGYSGY